jgi:hypothetical protein
MSSRRSGGSVEFGRLDDDDAAFEPDIESPSVRFPTERIDRRSAVAELAFDDAEGDFAADVPASGDDVESFAVHSPEDVVRCPPRGEYEPAESGTEIEMSVADAAVDPFAEPFAEEEAVVDRYASLAKTQPAKQPAVAPPRPAPRSPATDPSTPNSAVASASATPREQAPCASPTATVVIARGDAGAPAANTNAPVPWPSGNPAALDATSVNAAASSSKATGDVAGLRGNPAVRKPRKYGQLVGAAKLRLMRPGRAVEIDRTRQRILNHQKQTIHVAALNGAQTTRRKRRRPIGFVVAGRRVASPLVEACGEPRNR